MLTKEELTTPALDPSSVAVRADIVRLIGSAQDFDDVSRLFTDLFAGKVSVVSQSDLCETEGIELARSADSGVAIAREHDGFLVMKFFPYPNEEKTALVPTVVGEYVETLAGAVSSAVSFFDALIRAETVIRAAVK